MLTTAYLLIHKKVYVVVYELTKANTINRMQDSGYSRLLTVAKNW